MLVPRCQLHTRCSSRQLPQLRSPALRSSGRPCRPCRTGPLGGSARRPLWLRSSRSSQASQATIGHRAGRADRAVAPVAPSCRFVRSCRSCHRARHPFVRSVPSCVRAIRARRASGRIGPSGRGRRRPADRGPWRRSAGRPFRAVRASEPWTGARSLRRTRSAVALSARAPVLPSILWTRRQRPLGPRAKRSTRRASLAASDPMAAVQVGVQRAILDLARPNDPA